MKNRLNKLYADNRRASARKFEVVAKTESDDVEIFLYDHIVSSEDEADWWGGVAPESLLAYLGPAIGPDAFEVGQNVWDAFCLPIAQAEQAFEAIGDGKYLADIYMLARLILQREGVNQIFGGEHCTVLERDTFFSYRRDGQTGRMVSAIWLENNE